MRSNPPKIIQNVTNQGFKAYSGSIDSAKASLNILTKLRGIGPASASLMLSAYDPDTAPFFSDELFRWCFFEDVNGKGWDREIKYNLNEYLQLFEKVHDSKQRFKHVHERDVSAVELEKVAYVLAKRSASAGLDDTTTKRKATNEAGESEEVVRGNASDKASVAQGGRFSKRAKVSRTSKE